MPTDSHAALTPETMPLLMIHGAAMHAMADGKPEEAAHITATLAQRLRADKERAEATDDLLRRLSEWDVMSVTADGPYWLSEIAKVRGV